MKMKMRPGTTASGAYAAAAACCTAVVLATLVLGPLGVTTLVRLVRWPPRAYELLFGFGDALGVSGRTLAMIVWRIVMVGAGAAAAGAGAALLVLREEADGRRLKRARSELPPADAAPRRGGTARSPTGATSGTPRRSASASWAS